MGIKNILEREHQVTERFLNKKSKIPELEILEPNQLKRIGFISLYVKDIHHNLIVRLLNDQFGIQSRGGCSCAGTYGHVLLNIDYHESHRITHLIDLGDLSVKPGWIRISLHPTMINEEIDYIADALKKTIQYYAKWADLYQYDNLSGEFLPKGKKVFRLDLNHEFKKHCCF
jgi:selenocysteine lyase/cysteine desulfurase